MDRADFSAKLIKVIKAKRLIKKLENISLSTLIVPRLFKDKRSDIVFVIPSFRLSVPLM